MWDLFNLGDCTVHAMLANCAHRCVVSADIFLPLCCCAAGGRNPVDRAVSIR